MPAYLVRIIDTHDLVGLFVAADLHDLALLIDECTDPGECEFKRIGAGGIMWTGPAVAIPIEVPEDNDLGTPDPMPWSGATLTESWWDHLHGWSSRGRWKRLFPKDPDEPTTPQQSEPAAVLPFRQRRRRRT